MEITIQDDRQNGRPHYERAAEEAIKRFNAAMGEHAELLEKEEDAVRTAFYGAWGLKAVGNPIALYDCGTKEMQFRVTCQSAFVWLFNAYRILI